MKNYSYLVRVEGTKFPPIFIDTRRFNRLVSLATPLDLAVFVTAVCRGYDIITDFDLRVYSELSNYLKHTL